MDNSLIQKINQCIVKSYKDVDLSEGVWHKDYMIDYREETNQYIVDMTRITPPFLGGKFVVDKEENPFLGPGASNSNIKNLSSALTLTPSQHLQVDEILRSTGSIWLTTPANHYLVKLDISNGVKSIQSRLDLIDHRGPIGEDHAVEPGTETVYESRLIGDVAVLYFCAMCGGEYTNYFNRFFCVWMNLNHKRVEGVCWYSFPRLQGRMIQKDDIEFIDTHLRKNGDFGVYGSVTEGLDSLVTSCQVTLDDRADGNRWSIETMPKNGHGHAFFFSMDKLTGQVSQPITGHFTLHD